MCIFGKTKIDIHFFQTYIGQTLRKSINIIIFPNYFSKRSPKNQHTGVFKYRCTIEFIYV